VTLAPRPLYLNHPECLVVIFDVRTSEGAAALERHRSAWPDYSDVEVLDEGHRALIVRPGWVSERAA
jgi:hypothetical protein